jgi:hypothetical protein
MLRQLTVLGFEVENLSEVHQGKEHNQPLMLIHERMATLGASALGLYKAVKQGPEKIDIVGEGWQSHQGTSWEMGIFPKRESALPTLSSLSAFVHTPHISCSRHNSLMCTEHKRASNGRHICHQLLMGSD